MVDPEVSNLMALTAICIMGIWTARLLYFTYRIERLSTVVRNRQVLAATNVPLDVLSTHLLARSRLRAMLSHHGESQPEDMPKLQLLVSVLKESFVAEVIRKMDDSRFLRISFSVEVADAREVSSNVQMYWGVALSYLEQTLSTGLLAGSQTTNRRGLIIPTLPRPHVESSNGPPQRTVVNGNPSTSHDDPVESYLNSDGRDLVQIDSSGDTYERFRLQEESVNELNNSASVSIPLETLSAHRQNDSSTSFRRRQIVTIENVFTPSKSFTCAFKSRPFSLNYSLSQRIIPPDSDCVRWNGTLPCGISSKWDPANDVLPLAIVVESYSAVSRRRIFHISYVEFSSRNPSEFLRVNMVEPENIESSNTEISPLLPVIMKQVVVADGITFEIMDIYGLFDKRHHIPPIDGQHSKDVDNYDEGDYPECVVCLSGLKRVVLLPCRHLCVCQRCLAHLEKCPVCRTELHSYCLLVTSASTET